MRLAIGLLACLAAGCDVRSLLYPAPGLPVPRVPPAAYEEIWLESAAGDRLHGWHRAAGEARRPAVLLLHGNGENLGTLARSGMPERLAALDVSALLLDYPGYGRSDGRPREESLLAAGEAAVAWLAERHPDRPLVVMGWSLGAAVAVQLAATSEPVDGLVAASAWCSLESVARAHYPGFLVRLLLRERYDSLAAAPRVRLPVLVLHGEDDWIVPATEGERLAAAFPGEARWLALPGAGHNDLLGQPALWRAVREFLDALPRR